MLTRSAEVRILDVLEVLSAMAWRLPSVMPSPSSRHSIHHLQCCLRLGTLELAAFERDCESHLPSSTTTCIGCELEKWTPFVDMQYIRT